MRSQRVNRGLIAASTALLGATAVPAQVPMPLFSGPPVVPTEISSVYDIYHIQPMWIRNGVETPAVAQLVSILKRAPFDGFADGPQLAAKVEAAMADARSNPASAATAERICRPPG